MYSWGAPDLEFEYKKTEHACPECGQALLQVDSSSMLVCNDKHGPYFLV